MNYDLFFAGDGGARLRNLVGPTAPPARFGPYETHRLIGEGGMGSVWEATGPRGERVAIKLLNRYYGVTPKELDRFVREASLAMSVRHPNVVEVRGIDACDFGIYIVMELCGGRPLDAAVRVMPLKVRLGLLLQAARGLAAVHALGIVHRDMKPANVIIDGRGHAKVTDFGLARGAWAERVTGTSTALGTPDYMSPEQVERQHDRVGPWTDVWALGVMMYELMADRNPFRGSVRAVLDAEAPPIRRAWPSGLGQPLWWVCRKALSKEGRYRHRDAGAFADALEGALRQKGPRFRWQAGKR